MRSRHLLPNFRIAIVGAGAIGLYYGGKLAHFGRDVHFLLRTRLRDRAQARVAHSEQDREHSHREGKRLSFDRGDRAVRSGHRGGENDLQSRICRRSSRHC